MKTSKLKTIEYGDFQTPPELSDQACRLLARQGIDPVSIVEPTCGAGAFLISALESFPKTRSAIGLDISPKYIDNLKALLKQKKISADVCVQAADFFALQWDEIVNDLPSPLLVVGNPPWVTSDELGRRERVNLPRKSNFKNLQGIDAITGKGSFDISEWILLKILDALRVEDVMAMLCKTTVARKVLSQAWQQGCRQFDFVLYRVDAKKYFGVSVDACFLIGRRRQNGGIANYECLVFEKFDKTKSDHTIGFRDGKLIADSRFYDRWKQLRGRSEPLWRSGIKHDCFRVMELNREGSRYRNGFGENVKLERDYLYPMLKSSDLASGSLTELDRVMIVTQKTVGEDTRAIQKKAPKTWAYLQKYGFFLDGRRSSIYKGRPRFSVFGVGDYSFSPWKVAVSGFYKNLRFRVIGPAEEKPVILDDTAYFIPCETQEKARYLAEALNSESVEEFFRAYIFWDSKRPVTADLLNRLDLNALGDLFPAGHLEKLKPFIDF